MPIDLGIIVHLTLIVGGLLVLLAWLAEFLPHRLPPSGLNQRFRDVPGLQVFIVAQLGLTALCYLSLLWWERIRLGSHVPILAYPYATPFIPFSNFHDLLVYSNRMPYLHTPRFFTPAFPIPWQYPPAMAFPYVLLVLGRSHGVELFFLGVVPSLLLIGFLLARRFMAEGLSAVRAYGLVIGAFLLSYPFWTELALGNMEIVGFLLVVAAFWCYFRNWLYWAAILFGLAAAIKIFPFVYFALFFERRRFTPILAGIATIVAANLAGLWLLCPQLSFAWHQVQAGLAMNREHYMLTVLWQETAIDHSGFGLVKRIVGGHPGAQVSPHVLSVYMLAVATVGLLSYFLRIRKMPVLNQVAALSVASILLPPTSHDYTLINLYIPWALLVVFALQSARVPERVRGLPWAMLCFAVAFSSESELIHHRTNFSGQLKCLVLTVLFILVLCFPWRPLGAEDGQLAPGKAPLPA